MIATIGIIHAGQLPQIIVRCTRGDTRADLVGLRTQIGDDDCRRLVNGIVPGLVLRRDVAGQRTGGKVQLFVALATQSIVVADHHVVVGVVYLGKVVDGAVSVGTTYTEFVTTGPVAIQRPTGNTRLGRRSNDGILRGHDTSGAIVRGDGSGRRGVVRVLCPVRIDPSAAMRDAERHALEDGVVSVVVDGKNDR